ncbi:MAG: phosphatase PAP2 family protein [Microbacterium sp.]
MVREQQVADAGALRALPLVIWGLVLVALSVGLGAWIFARENGPFDLDTWWNTLLATEYVPLLSGFSLVMNFLGGGWFGVLVVPIAGTVALFLLRRPWSAAYFLTAQAVSAGIVQLLKSTYGRARPEDIAVISDHGSFPSGHVAGAATLATVVVVLFPRLAVVILGAAWVLLMAFSRTYIHAHWLSDTLGGALVGVGTALVVAAIMAVPLNRELSTRRRAPSLG